MDNSMNLFEQPSEPAFLIGKLITTFFASDDGFYKVLLVQIEQTNIEFPEEEIVVTGNFGDINDETSYKFIGKLVNHPRYGQQFQATNYSQAQPTTKQGIINFLSGDQFKGIGKKTAEKIVDQLGLNAINKIVADSTVLAPLHLKPNLVQTLVDHLNTVQGMDKIIIGLNDFGFGSSLAGAIYEKYRDETLEVIMQNPYQLVADIDGISFKRADAVAQKLHIGLDDPRRVQAAILQVLDDVTVQTGDTYTTAKPLVTKTLALLEENSSTAIAPNAVSKELIDMAKQNEVVAQDDRIYPATLFQAEWQIAQHLYRIQTAVELETSAKQAQKALKQVERQLDIDYDQSQEEAILVALKSRIFLLTGGPGTGKTTIINGIVAAFAKLHDYSLDINEYKQRPFPILLAAPTGRAAKQMSETTGLPASTIHRLLGLNGREAASDMNVKDLDGALLIIDELSMVDTLLFKALLQAIPSTMQVVFVGDKDQLPSVGPGQVFHDLLDFEQLPKKELTQIYRQNEDSSIIPLAHHIKMGQVPTDLTTNFPDRSFIACEQYQVADVVEQITKKAMAKKFDAKDVQVLAPMYRGSAGINQLNTLVQNVFNDNSQQQRKEVEFRGQHFRIGDKVLHLVNSPEDNVFNGDIGTIVGIEPALKNGKENKSDALVIAFEQTEVTYPRNEWQRITLAYCISIHKSQGSQFQMVILPLVNAFHKMLQRNLLYTAVTRAQSKLIMVGEPSAFAACIENQSVNRKTSLPLRLRATFNDETIDQQEVVNDEPNKTNEQDEIVSNDDEPGITENHQLTQVMIANGKVDPMIGMHGIKPDDFMAV